MPSSPPAKRSSPSNARCEMPPMWLGFAPARAVRPCVLTRPPPRRLVPAGLALFFPVSARTERAVPRAGEDQGGPPPVVPRVLERGDQLVNRATAERVHPLRPVDR